MKCTACQNEEDNFIRLRQLGVMNLIRSERPKEPEIMFDILICPICGNMQVDIKTIRIDDSKPIWTDPYGERWSK